MEYQPGSHPGVQITRAAFDELEFIRQSGVTNMLDRSTVLHLAREGDLTHIAEWIERVDTGTYGSLILEGPDVVDIDTAPEVNQAEPAEQVSRVEFLNQTTDDERSKMRDVMAMLGKQASLTIADTYETELMGVLFDPSRRDVINAERNALIRNLGEASTLWLQIEETMNEIQRGIGSLQYIIDPENN